MNCVGQPLFGWIVGFAFLGMLHIVLWIKDAWRKWSAERGAKS